MITLTKSMLCCDGAEHRYSCYHKKKKKKKKKTKSFCHNYIHPLQEGKHNLTAVLVLQMSTTKVGM